MSEHLKLALEALKLLLDDVCRGGMCILCRHKAAPLAMHHADCPVPRAAETYTRLSKQSASALEGRAVTDALAKAKHMIIHPLREDGTVGAETEVRVPLADWKVIESALKGCA